MADGNFPTDIRVDIGAYEAQSIPSADFDADLDVDGADFLAWQRGFGVENAVRADGNSDDDVDVDASDLAAWMVSYREQSAISGQLSASLAEVGAVWEGSKIDRREESEFASEELPFVAVDEVSVAIAYSLTVANSVQAETELVLESYAAEPESLWLTDEILDQLFG